MLITLGTPALLATEHRALPDLRCVARRHAPPLLATQPRAAWDGLVVTTDDGEEVPPSRSPWGMSVDRTRRWVGPQARTAGDRRRTYRNR